MDLPLPDTFCFLLSKRSYSYPSEPIWKRKRDQIREMGMQLMRSSSYHRHRASKTPAFSASLHPFSSSIVLRRSLGFEHGGTRSTGSIKRRIQKHGIVASSNLVAPPWESWNPEKGSASPSLSDIVWPSAGAFAAMAILGRVDQILAPKGVSMTIAPLGAVCAVLFATPSSPAARKYNMFMAQIGCASIGVLAFSLFGPGWLARSFALAASIAFMTYTRSPHPPAASLPILFIDGAKLHHLNFWYALFPGAAGCLLLCLIVSSYTNYDQVPKSCHSFLA
ncbi:unnamed protein product [Prunus armeniaca]